MSLSSPIAKKSWIQSKCLQLLADHPHLWLSGINPDLYDDLYLAILKSQRMRKMTRCQVQIRLNPAAVRICGRKLPCGNHTVQEERCTATTRSTGKQCRHPGTWANGKCYSHHFNPNVRTCAQEGCTKRGFADYNNNHWCWEHLDPERKCPEKTLNGKPCRRLKLSWNESCRKHRRCLAEKYQCKIKECSFMKVYRPYFVEERRQLEQFQYCWDHCRQFWCVKKNN